MTTTSDRVALLAAALETGDYPQSTGRLRTPHGYCCLGVACDVYHNATGLGDWQHDPKRGWFFTIAGATTHEILPAAVARWYGFTNPNPILGAWNHDPRYTRAASWNDNGATFGEIAAALRRAYPPGSPCEPA